MERTDKDALNPMYDTDHKYCMQLQNELAVFAILFYDADK
jgi:hypothetical protein